MPKTFDPGDFDIHEFEDQKPKVYPITKKEKIDSRAVKGIGKETRAKKPGKGLSPGKRIFTAFVGNVLLPGLGNVLLKKTKVGVGLLLLNVGFLVTTASPTSMLGFLGTIAYPKIPEGLRYAVIMPVGPSTGIAVKEVMLPIFYATVLLAFVSWLHFFYLLTKNRQ